MSRFQKDDDLSIEDPSTRSESPISPPKDSEESIHLTGIKLPPTSAAGASKSEDLSVLSSYKSATSTPSIHSSKSDETFHSALPSLSTERTISALDKSNPSKSSLGETETDVNFVPSTSSSNTASGDTNKFLDYDDFFAAKKLLGKLCKTMVESSCHHAKKTQEFNKNLDKIGSAVEDHASVLKAFIDDFDVKAAEKVKQMVHKIDPQMSALEEIAEFSSALDSLDGWLHLCEVENDQRLETLEIAQKNLVKQKELELMVSACFV
uniref:Uncharacterized protein n=1 Tax=Panagrolaimus sp. ES5 TaxID=591445 RepID=A0AC34GAY0_9BILA